MKIKTPVRYDYEDWMLFDADDQWLASFDVGDVGPEVRDKINAHDALVTELEHTLLSIKDAKGKGRIAQSLALHLIERLEFVIAKVHGEAA